MAVYSELIKNFDKIRDYVRDFYVFGFRTRGEFDSKSSRTYDNEKRRIESWLSGYIHSSQTGHRKKVSVKIDSSRIFENPLYKCYKSKSFTDNDIRLHFILMDILEEKSMTVSEITDRIISDYNMLFDQQIVRLKLKEYVGEGLVNQKKIGNTIYFSKAGCFADEILKKLPQLSDMISFFSEEIPFGVVGNFLMQKAELTNRIFTRKHSYMVHTLDDEILLEVIGAMRKKCRLTLSCAGVKNRRSYEVTAVPLIIRSSVQTGRNYIIMYSESQNRLMSVRVDAVKRIISESQCDKYDEYYRFYENNEYNLWGISFGNSRKYGQTEHIRMEILIDEDSEQFIVNRLMREGRGGTVIKLADGRYAFDIDLFDANEAFPWIKTFVGRIALFETSNPELNEKFRYDLQRLHIMYGGDKV